MGKRLFVFILAIVSVLSLPFLFLNSANLVLGFLGVQETFVLDFNNTVFNYTLTKFGDSNMTQEFDFNESGGNQTYYLLIPKNATVQNISMNLTGKLTTIYKQQVSINEIRGISIGNVTIDSNNEISIGTKETDGKVKLLSGENGSVMWNVTLASSQIIYSTDIGNVTSDSGEEIVVGSEDNYIYLLDSDGLEIWKNDTNSDVNSVKIADVHVDAGNEIIAGSNNKVFLFNSTNNLLWNITINNLNQLAIGDITSDSGDEIVVGCSDGWIYVLNSTGIIVDSFTITGEINTLDVGNISSSLRDEIVLGTGSSKIIILNSTGAEIKNYTAGGSINSVKIGELTSDYQGNEIIAGSTDKKVYIFNNTGDLIAEFLADNVVYTVAIGDLNSDAGNEVAAGGAGGYVYTFNFDYFPTNLSIDIGGDSTKDWNCTEEKLRNSKIATGGNLVSAINNYLINICSPDADNNCQVPLVFNSIFKGKLNISNLNVTYSYNTTNIIYHNGSAIPNWSRTNNIEINEEVGYGVYAVNFEGIPAENITINYITVNQSATTCDFNLSSYSTATVNGKKLCNISSNPIHLIGGELINPSLQLFLWDNTMQNATPLSIFNTTEYYSTSDLDDYNKWINLTFNATNGTFTNATAWWSVNDSEIDGEEFLKSGECNLTPENEQSNCDTASPTYTQIDCSGDIFYVCKETVGSDMYFKWKQLSLSSSREYIAGGSYNLKPNLTNLDITPSSEIWSANFTFSVDVSDVDSDIINLTLWVFENQTGNWTNKGVASVSNGNMEFNLTSDKNWTGTSRFLFEYFDCNQSDLSQKFHSATNTTITNFNVLKHDISVVYNESLGCSGNDSLVFRNDSLVLSVFVNDTNSSDDVEGANCSLWVGGVFANYTQSNATGFCNFNFTPDQSFNLGHSNWKIGIFNDAHYTEGNSTELNITIRGSIHPEITNPVNFSFYKNEPTTFHAGLLNLYGLPVNEAGYNCSFYMDNTSTPIGNSSTNTSGGCSLDYNNSGSFEVGQRTLIVVINKTGVDNYYNISDNQTNRSVLLLGRLNLTILSPLESGSYYKGQNLSINSSVEDNCGQSVDGANVNWHLVNKYNLNVTIEDTSGINRTNYPIILNGSFFADSDFEFIDWKLNNTYLQMEGATISFSIYPWTSAGKLELNNSRVYMDNLTELVFLINLTANTSKVLEINLKDSNPSMNDVEYNILNAGFDSGDFSLWDVSLSGDCTAKVSLENETYFADLSADHNSLEVFQYLLNITKTDKINISYKAWGEFYLSESFVGNFSLKIGNVVCDLTPWNHPYGPYVPSEQPWDVVTCEDSSFSSAENISIFLRDDGDGGTPASKTYAQINYICFVDDAGACVDFHSGVQTQLNLTHRKEISSNINDTYLLEGTEDVGRRKIIAEAEKLYYDSDLEIRYFNLTGFSYVKNLTINSEFCTLNSTTGIWQYRCMVNASLALQCVVADNYTSSGIVDYSVDFYNSTPLFIGNNTTNSQGMAIKESQIYGDGTYRFSCNITDQSDIFYNATGTSGRLVEATVLGTNTTAELNITPEYLEALNITIIHNVTQNMTFVLINNGSGDMYDPVINISSISGVYLPELVCDPIQIGDNCTKLFNITITSEADVGNRTIWFNITWQNGDATYDTVNKNITIFIESNPQLEFVEDNLSLSVPITSDRTTNFTILNYGNVNLTNVIINLTGENSSTFIDLTTFSNNTFNLELGGEETIFMTVNASTLDTSWIGSYDLNITLNTSDCSDCLRRLPFTLEITPLDWDATPLILNKTVGLKAEVNKLGEVVIDNIKDENFDFNLSITRNSGTTTEYLTLNDTHKATQILITVTNNTERIIEVFYNTSVDPDAIGTYNYTLKVENLDSGVPEFINISIFFEIINFTVDIISPNGTFPVGNIEINDTLEINVTALSGSDSVGENMSWIVLVGGEYCPIINYSYHSGNELWNINCTAPNITNNILRNDLEVTGTYTVNNIVLSDLEEDSIIYKDSISPWFSNITADFINNNTYTQDYIIFEVNITDNKNISSVSAKVTHTNTGEYWNLNSNNYSETYLSAENEFDKRNFVFNFSRPEYTGDYDIIVYANDTTIGNAESNKTGWFDIYIPVQVSGNLTDPDGTPIDANFTFYREGSDLDEAYKMHENTTESSEIYNWTLHKRKYDIKIDMFGQEIVLHDADFNNSNNLNNPFKFDYYSNHTCTHLTSEDLATARYPIIGIVIDTNLTDSAEFEIDFEAALQNALNSGFSIQRDNLEVIACHNWSYSSQTCDSSFEYVNRSIAPEGNIISFSVSDLSAFFVAEACYSSGNDLIDCSGYGDPPIIPPSPSSPSGSTGGSTTVDLELSTCGDGVCEVGENYQNCPQDCPLDDFPLIVDTNLANVRIFQGDSRTYQLSLKSRMSGDVDVGLVVTGTLKELLSLSSTRKVIQPGDTEELDLYLTIPMNQSTGIYSGNIELRAGAQAKNIPISITVLEKATAVFSVELELATKEINPGDNLEFLVKLINLGEKKTLPINLTYIIKEQKTGKIIREVNTSVVLETTKILRESISLNITEKGYYNLEVWAIYYDRGIMDVETFEVVRPLFETPWMVGLILIALLMGITVGGTYIWRYYIIWKKEKEKEERYLYPLDYRKVPREGFKIGKFAGTNNYCYYDPKDLTTHLISAGATGAGKSVSASVIAEEALDKNVPVIVFDPTAQWTGFVKACKDTNLTRRYKEFDMSDFDIKSYPGLIYDVEKPDFELKIKEFINPGEITIFCLNKLKPGEYDKAVDHIIKSIFGETWEESSDLKLLLVFDEVHRLLEKYGGTGGYVALEKAAREFRKWGIGIIMCSQVLADFKSAISGNVLTEIQLNTKSLVDIEKVKTKYGEQYSQRITRMGVGAGLMQYPKYNDGKPFFVEFRPTKHDPHKITEAELSLYKTNIEKLKLIESKIKGLKERKIYTEDYELDFKLAMKKLKTGNFRMVEIYITSLEKSLEKV